MAMFGLLAILYYTAIAALMGLIVYTLVFVIIFLRLRIQELKSTHPLDPRNGP
jgi:hypothetical protein